MQWTDRECDVLFGFVRRRIEGGARSLQIDVRPLRGGLESQALQVGARFTDLLGRRRLFHFVVKRLEGRPAREAEVYDALTASAAGSLSPGLLGVERTGQDRCLLFLERVRAARRWPWAKPELAARVLERLAELHAASTASQGARPLASWDYEAELLSSARQTLATLERLPRKADLLPLRRGLHVLRRLVSVLPSLRRQLLDFPGLPRTVIHGDVHTGNVLLRMRRGRLEPVLLDWGRARIGSPLEDVSSWLQSLGYWEFEARRRHDTLFLRYLGARGLPPRLKRDLRDTYWLAGASNVLAGALSYHAGRAAEAPESSRARAVALHAAVDAMRIIRRADACWTAPTKA